MYHCESLITIDILLQIRKRSMNYSVVFLLAIACCAVYAVNRKSSYGHVISMDEEENYLMYWTSNDATQTIDIALVVNTTGWIGFGISPYTGTMPGSDIVIGWVSHGKAYLQVT